MALLLRLLLRLFLVALVAVGCWFGYLYVVAGQARELVESVPGECLEVPGTPGAEDITIDRFHETALISSDPRDGTPGAIYAYSLSEPQASPRNLSADLDRQLFPHGLSLWSPENQPSSVLADGDSSVAGDSSGARLFVRQPSESGWRRR